MFIKSFEWLISLRYLRSKRKERFISVVSIFSLVGIALGVATLIIVMSVMNGYHKEFLKNILGIQGHLTITNTFGKITNYEEYDQKIAQFTEVKFVAPVIISQAMFINNQQATGGIVRGIDPEKLSIKPLISSNVSQALLDRFKKKEGVLIGKDLAHQLNVATGDTIKIVAPDAGLTIIGALPRLKTFKVIGVFDVGLYQYNATTVFMPLEDAQLLFKYPNQVSELEVMVANPENLKTIKREIQNSLDQDAVIIDWEKAQEKWLNALMVERNVMFFILTLIILVAVFNIVSSLIMLVKDKARNIAILRTMGASKSSIIRIFVVCGTLLGGIGTFFGTLLGILFAINIERIRSYLELITGNKLFDPVIYFLTKLPSDLQPGNVVLIVIMSLLFSFLATIYPAYRASKLTPAEVLRYE